MSVKKGLSTVLVTIVEARGLSTKTGGVLDTFVGLRWGKKKFKTGVRKKSTNPSWGEVFELKYEPGIVELVVELYAKSWSDSLIGQVSILVDVMKKEGQIDKWVLLKGGKSLDEERGELKVIIDLDRETREQAKEEMFRIVEEEEVVLVLDEEECVFPGQKVRTTELHRPLGIKRLKHVDVVLVDNWMAGFMLMVDEIKPSLIVLQKNNASLTQIYGRYFTLTTNDQREELANQMSLIIDHSNIESSKLSKCFKSMEQANSTVAKEGFGNGAEIRIRNNIYNVLSKSFLDIMLEFQHIQTQYKSMHRKTVRNLYSLTNPMATEKELEDAESLDMSQILTQAVIDVRRDKAKDALSYVKGRHNEIVKIEQGLLEIQRLFNDMAILVAAQAEFVDRIQDNVSKAKESTKQGEIELRKARYYQNHKFKLSPVAMAKIMK